EPWERWRHYIRREQRLPATAMRCGTYALLVTGESGNQCTDERFRRRSFASSVRAGFAFFLRGLSVPSPFSVSERPKRLELELLGGVHLGGIEPQEVHRLLAQPKLVAL